MGEQRIRTDVLVIGGGLAGCFAAVRALESGAKVVLAEKNHVGKSGSSHFARDYLLFREEWGDNYDEWMQQFSQVGEYIADRNWDDILLRESYPRFRDLVSWGEPFYLKNGEVGFPEPGEEPFRLAFRRTKYRRHALIAKWGAREKMTIARKKVLKSGGEILDRVMITELIEKDGRVGGAVGFNVRTGDLYVIEAAATIVSAGGMGFRSSRYGLWFNTGDGMTMAYRAGAKLTGMELGRGMYVVKDVNTVVINGPVAEIGKRKDRITNGRGEEFLDDIPHIVTNIQWAIEFHQGRGPIYHEAYGIDREAVKEQLKKYDETAEGPWITMLDRAGLDIFHDRFEQYMTYAGSFATGGLRIGTDCQTDVPGLFAAGDSSGTNYSGANYSALGSGMARASVTGYRAGENAAAYARGATPVRVGQEDVARYLRNVFAPLERKNGFRPAHLIRRIQETLFPYEMRIVMHGKRLQAGLTMIEFFKERFASNLFATNLHELRTAHEAINMALGAEIVLRTALMRTESRGWFYREDYPQRDDENWLKWTIVGKEGGQMRLSTEPVPEAYQGDKSLPYEVRYPLQYQQE